MSDTSELDSPFCRRSKSDRLRDLRRDAFSHTFSSPRVGSPEDKENISEDEFYSADEVKSDGFLSEDSLSNSVIVLNDSTSCGKNSEKSRTTTTDDSPKDRIYATNLSSLSSNQRNLRCRNQKLDFEDSSADRREKKPIHSTKTASTSEDSDSESDMKYLNSLRRPISTPESTAEDRDESNDGKPIKRRTNSFIVDDDEIGSPLDKSEDEDDESDQSEEPFDGEDEESDAELVVEVKKRVIDEKKTPVGKVAVALLKSTFSSPSVKKPAIDGSEHFLISLNKHYKYTRHLDAEKFIDKNFKKNREELAKSVFKHVNDTCFKSNLPEDLPIIWNPRLRKTAGFCRYKRQKGDDFVSIVRTVTVELSTKVITEPERLRDTLIHELCHAAVFLIDKVEGDHHGPYWSKWANICMKRHPKLPFVSRCHNYEIVAKYLYLCNGCGQKVRRHSKSLDISKKICGVCRGRFELQVLTKGEYKRRSLTTTQSPKNTFAKFVKLHYSTVKKPGIAHKEVMQLLSAKWKVERPKMENDKKSPSEGFKINFDELSADENEAPIMPALHSDSSDDDSDVQEVPLDISVISIVD
ncbi:unnamed protein product, partial [Mesorhabditis belari]|uniref:SprT-like domain-containing protein n=1 Tax=Mesorhabditis belari TaxID=2138241 RepID=A0AAF3EXJ5_9BILA